MFSMRKLSLRFKTVMIAMATSTLALAISGIFFSLYDYRLAKIKTEEEFSVIAKILADRSTAALEFADEEQARENLNALQARTSVVLGCLYTEDDRLFASFNRPSYSRLDCPGELVSAGEHSDDQYLAVNQVVTLDEARIGTLYLLADMGDLQETMFLHLITSFFIISFSLFVTFLLAVRLQAFVTIPIRRLQDTVIKIRQSDNYSLRATDGNRDESLQ